MPQKKNIIPSAVSLILSAASIVSFFIFSRTSLSLIYDFLISGILSSAGLVTGIVSCCKNKKASGIEKILGIVSVYVSAICLVFFIVFFILIIWAVSLD